MGEARDDRHGGAGSTGDSLDDEPIQWTPAQRVGVAVGVLLPYSLAAAIIAANRVQQRLSDECTQLALAVLAVWIVVAAVLLRRHLRGPRAFGLLLPVFVLLLLALLQWAMRSGAS